MINSALNWGYSSTTTTQLLVQPGFISIGDWAGSFQLCEAALGVNRDEFSTPSYREAFFSALKNEQTQIWQLFLWFFFLHILLSASWLNTWAYESKHTGSVKCDSRFTEWKKKITCCAVLLTFSGSNHHNNIDDEIQLCFSRSSGEAWKDNQYRHFWRWN